MHERVEDVALAAGELHLFGKLRILNRAGRPKRYRDRRALYRIAELIARLLFKDHLNLSLAQLLSQSTSRQRVFRGVDNHHRRHAKFPTLYRGTQNPGVACKDRTGLLLHPPRGISSPFITADKRAALRQARGYNLWGCLRPADALLGEARNVPT